MLQIINLCFKAHNFFYQYINILIIWISLVGHLYFCSKILLFTNIVFKELM